MAEVSKSFVDLSHITHPETIVRVSGRLTAQTKITQMGISATAAKQLTPAAAKLTKADLVALEGPNASAVASKLHLSTADITSVKEAFAQPINLGGVGGTMVAGKFKISISCCCCTPCCCAAAAIEPVQAVA